MIRLGGGQGFYGDGHGPVADLLAEGVDYLVCEALAELTLAILQKDRQRDESLGYTRDLPMYVAQAIPAIVEGRTKLITNAGGINPLAAGRAAAGVLREAGASGVSVATV
ncbi:MAG: acyclic terpene utilization AtuA family protein, partial [Acidimicrobiales bacterium]